MSGKSDAGKPHREALRIDAFSAACSQDRVSLGARTKTTASSGLAGARATASFKVAKHSDGEVGGILLK